MEDSIEHAMTALSRNRNDIFMCQGIVYTLQSAGYEDDANEQLARNTPVTSI